MHRAQLPIAVELALFHTILIRLYTVILVTNGVECRISNWIPILEYLPLHQF